MNERTFVIKFNGIVIHEEPDTDEGYRNCVDKFTKILTKVVWPQVYETVPNQRNIRHVRIGRLTANGEGNLVHVYDYLEMRCV